MTDKYKDTIVAVATPYGSGGLAVVRLSGPDALKIADNAWRGKHLPEMESHTARLGQITDGDNSIIDSAVALVFKAPHSFTGEDTVEFSLHGSLWIQREVVRRLTELGARPAGPGEFSQRAFLNGRLDLAQAEGVADLINASSRAAHRLAMSQLKGEFSSRLETLRNQLVELASLLELELDFSEEDVEFADRSQLLSLADSTAMMLRRLTDSYASGMAFKTGVPVAIAGAPNVGKSTLLNFMLNEEKAIVSNIPGTTRDIIEDSAEIDGILFRFSDTAGLRNTNDEIESIGIEKAKERIAKSRIILWMADASNAYSNKIDEIMQYISRFADKKNLILLNKSDIADGSYEAKALKEKIKSYKKENTEIETIAISAKTGAGTSQLKEYLVRSAKEEFNPDNELIVTNARHHAALKLGLEAINRVREGIESGISADFVAQDIREALHHLGEVTGSVTTDTLLATIFSRFCIGK
ncbi:MAG: tRNA uridine-5-carboxymethylaminomethyl(34) synthesis GTPase MnmE [Candidatus Amulumruptor caecigallinarius]|nr:tRNA uridine-5-carboxymethylaminomethyl(34) synthesis GTPase MnmE [Candidatus Amulumruptor caecigallinarius]